MSHLKKLIQKYEFLLSFLFLTFLGLSGFWIYKQNFSVPYAVSNTADTPSEEDFEHYLEELFQSEAASNTLNLHFSLKNPQNAGIKEYPVTLGHISTTDDDIELLNYENMKASLLTFQDTKLSKKLQFTYDILLDSINQSLALSPYYYYNEILSSTNGAQAEIPILLSEYSFYTKKDVEDYLGLLADYDSYFEEICEFEKQKANHGLFMNEKAVNNLIEQCKAFAPQDFTNSFWETTFSDRLNQMDDLSKKEKKAYIKRNHELLAQHIYPAYQNLVEVLSSLKDTGKNSQGLCYFDEGKQYYKLLVQSTTGSNRSIPELESLVDNRRTYCLNKIQQLLDMNQTEKRNISTDNLSLNGNSIDLPYQTPEEILEHLQTEIQNKFPTLPETNYTVKTVDDRLKDFLAPAFYLTSPIDDASENSIYINPGNHYNEIELFTTLAHEGYPGHLYQTVYSYQQHLPNIRYLLYHGGYTEGWATYVEMLSYHYAGLDSGQADLLRLNQDATLSLYASMDLGIHYEGWTLADAIEFLSSYGVRDVDTVALIYQAIIENPANYLKYYIGYLEFLNLRAQTVHTYGKEHFSELAFHTAILKLGSSPFYLLEEYLPAYYEEALENLND